MTMAKKRKGGKRGKRKATLSLSINPVGSLKKASGGTFKKVALGVGIGLGAVAVAAIGQNVIPSSWRDGNTGALAFAGAAVVAGVAIRTVSKGATAQKVADYLTVGGVAAATLSVASPVVLPKVQFNLIGEIDNRIAVAGPGINEIDRRLAVPAPGRTLGETSPRAMVAAGLMG